MLESVTGHRNKDLPIYLYIPVGREKGSKQGSKELRKQASKGVKEAKEARKQGTTVMKTHNISLDPDYKQFDKKM